MSLETPDISLIFVNYRSAAYLRRSIQSLLKCEDEQIRIEIIIVNNDQEESQLLRDIQKDYPQVFIVESGGNVGFGKAINRGVAASQAPLLGFLNPDTCWPKTQLTALCDALRQTPAIVGLLLLDESGRQERYSFGREVTLFRLLLNHLCSFPHLVENQQYEMAWVSGGALFCTRTIFDTVQGFDEEYFLYYEDVDFCYRARKKQIPVIIDTHFSLIHYGGKSQESTAQQKQAYYTSQRYYFKKTRPWYEGMLLRWVHVVFG